MRKLANFPPGTLDEELNAFELKELEVYFESLPLGGDDPREWRRRRFENSPPEGDLEPGESMRNLGKRLDHEIRRIIREDRGAMGGCRLLTAARFFGPTLSCQKRREVTQSWHVDKEHFPPELWQSTLGEPFQNARLTEWHVVLPDRPSGGGTEFAADEAGRILQADSRDEYSLDPDWKRIIRSPIKRLHERKVGEVHRAPKGDDSRLSIVYLPVPSSVETIT